MALNIIPSFNKIALFFYIFLKYLKNPNTKNLHSDATTSTTQPEFQEFRFLGQKPDLENRVVIFDVEKALLKSSSLFPYFMLVAFEAGSPIRSLILLLLYPLIRVLAEGFAFKAMVMICFLGLKSERFKEGKSVLPKFFLEDVGMESFLAIRRAKTTVAVSSLPQIMVESFLIDYLDVDFVVGRDLKLFHGYFLGFMEQRREPSLDGVITSSAIGFCSSKLQPFPNRLFSSCKEIYLVSDEERRNWHQLARDSYPKPLILHDGRLAFRPTFAAAAAMFAWLPFGFALAVARAIVFFAAPPKIALWLLHLLGMQLRVSKSKAFSNSVVNRKLLGKGILYVCNHRTLFDPVFIYYSLETPLTAVTYGLSRVSETVSVIDTVRLTRNRARDAELMRRVLGRGGDLVVCPEGTTCREAYLLRFSPLFAEISDEIFPVAVDCRVGMFYGTTAGGSKWMDPLFFLMNPRVSYAVRFLDVVRGANDGGDGESRFVVANLVQNQIAKALGFTCTKVTRKDKYLILAGNDGNY
ncbi:probable glycerol-3-phosphate acyltransferase 2 [Salvia miltiorrhiza]|uniref:probable glycerol-3-phosphate acyltransferase 2 n=1 Tax=Salvia miltiorrhiza TaxID=226208 RepID=UPI0025ACBC39|nr:probable glycerol-3-phosphate acyltransferase 2 [Salvia miltiorrhiza]